MAEDGSKYISALYGSGSGEPAGPPPPVAAPLVPRYALLLAATPGYALPPVSGFSVGETFCSSPRANLQGRAYAAEHHPRVHHREASCSSCEKRISRLALVRSRRPPAGPLSRSVLLLSREKNLRGGGLGAEQIRGVQLGEACCFFFEKGFSRVTV